MTLPLPFEDSSSSNFVLPPPPDLLRRFVALPYQGTWVIAGVPFEVATNREELLLNLPLLQGTLTTRHQVQLKVIVDSDITPAHHSFPLIAHSEQMFWGRVCGALFVFDGARCESFIFLPEALVREFNATFGELLKLHRCFLGIYGSSRLAQRP